MVVRLKMRTSGGSKAAKFFQERASAKSQGGVVEYGYIEDVFVSDKVPLATAAYEAELFKGRPFMRQANARVEDEARDIVLRNANKDGAGITEDGAREIGELGVEETLRSAVQHGYKRGEHRRMSNDARFRLL